MYPFEFYLPAMHMSSATRDRGHPTSGAPASAFRSIADGRAPRRRRTRLAALSVLLLAAAGTWGAAVSGAWSDRTPAPTLTSAVSTHRTPTAPARHLPPGPHWLTTTQLSTPKGVFALSVHAAITAPGTARPDPANRTNALVTVPQVAGWYTLTNTGSAPYDLAEPVRVFAYWKVPVGLCTRWAPMWTPNLTENNIPIIPTVRGQELCPMAFGDSTLDTLPQTLRPNRPAVLAFTATNLVLGQDYPLHETHHTAAMLTRAFARPPDGWLAVDEQLSTDSHHTVASTGLGAP